MTKKPGAIEEINVALFHLERARALIVTNTAVHSEARDHLKQAIDAIMFADDWVMGKHSDKIGGTQSQIDNGTFD